MTKKLLRFPYRRILLILIDVLCFAVVSSLYLAATYLVDRSLTYQTNEYVLSSLILIACILIFRLGGGIYFNVWRYTNTTSFLKLIVADALGAVFGMLICKMAGLYRGFWFFVTVSALNALLTLSSRFCYRLAYKFFHRNTENGESKSRIPVAIVGAGQIGSLLANELQYGRTSNYKPLFFIDSDYSKAGSRVAGLKVYPEIDSTLDVIREHGISEIFVAMTGLDNEKASNLYHFYSRTSCKIKVYDIPLRDVGAPKSLRRSLRDFSIEDLLFRKSLNVTDEKSRTFYENKVVMVTGGGGSIGSELCRGIASCHPKKLIILDIYENNAYEIQQELIRNYGADLDLSVVIASVRDRERMDAVFAEYRPEIVFHAAAHKHVPLMEENRCEAIKNNIFGTNNTADMAEKYGARKFILISTDKAVNPTNVMGASKRMCEMIVQSRTDSNTAFAAVGFGNVLGSNGSVIPLFRHQIEQGGPVTITDKRIIRYFMTIPEASQLVMQAGAMAKRGELFVLDMGKPVLIYDLATSMIRLSGLVPNEDIMIKEIGLRPGEKLYEELLIKTENLDKTENNLIFVEHDQPLSREVIRQKLDYLAKVVKENEHFVNSDAIRKAMKKVVPTFCDPDEINCRAAESEEMKQVVAESPISDETGENETNE